MGYRKETAAPEIVFFIDQISKMLYNIKNSLIYEKSVWRMNFWEFVKEQAAVICEKDPAVRSKWEIILYPSFQVQLSHRRAHRLYLKGHYFLARWISQRAKKKTGIEIHPGATLGRRLCIDHGTGVVIGETAEIGDDVTIYQGVTLGGTGKEKGKRHPTVGNHVLISADAQILGSFKIGDHSRIGAGSVVLNEVPGDCTVVGIPGRVVRRGNQKIDAVEELDHTHLPDPVAMEICRLQNRIGKLEAELTKQGVRIESTLQDEEEIMQCFRIKTEGEMSVE